MKTGFYKLLLLLTAAAMLLLCAGCGGNSAQSTPASQSAAQDGESEAGPDADTPADAKNAEDTGAPEADAQGMSLEEYMDMAAKFAFFCESVYFNYQGDRGLVLISDVQVEEETEDQCRIRVQYLEPSPTNDPNVFSDPTDGYMIFVVDKATSQATMECWEFLGVAGEYLPESVDQMSEAEYYSSGMVNAGLSDGPMYALDDVYDFQAGMLLSAGGEDKADVNAYWSGNMPEA